MRVEQLGEGDPELAIVGSIHGDEPCGKRAIEGLLEADLEVTRPVKLVIANEAALEENVRYLEEDLNRAFPGDPDGDTHESRLAHRLLQEIRGCTVFSLHSTQSYAAPFALVDDLDPLAETVVPYLTVEAVVETGKFSEGRLIEQADVIEVECGLQGSEGAAQNGYLLCTQFLAGMGALAADEPRRVGDVPVFRLERQLPKPTGVPGQYEYEVFAANFERVAEGSTYARANDESFVADRPFYPVLLSAYGYEDVFGYGASLVGRLDEHPRVDPEAATEQR
ncbi:succinylglutamate desuccinylase/aspartoacylase domain-containing protein [Halorarius litoreus]|uniref:succinylglutamate desuccinylase/aspartoacylase domain-containing protein n=1 Tax=Halorarius litoreus TaxID=2962676 RepID=UPI0020CC5659|nr:succinylglutamate desuccinylase/aspartoacylase family protein [Halorarius litoreus]